jgi:hypothetical protein
MDLEDRNFKNSTGLTRETNSLMSGSIDNQVVQRAESQQANIGLGESGSSYAGIECVYLYLDPQGSSWFQ